MSRVPVFFCLLLLVPSCTAMTHSSEYETFAPPGEERLCALCASRPDLLHPPCPPEPPIAPGDLSVAFAMRSIDLGIRASGWSAGYVVGLDQDCSSRPLGKPVQCAPRSEDIVFERLANGVDNALATQVLYPLLQSEQVNPQELINQTFESAFGGILIVIDGWNGERNDDQVGVRMLPAQTTMEGGKPTPPAWDGSDSWVAYADRFDPAFPGRRIPDTDNKTAQGYVTDGTLVWDARSLSAFLMPFGAGRARVDIRLSNVVLVADMVMDGQPRRLDNAVLAGVWSAFLASRNAGQLAEIVAKCDPDEVKRLTPEIEDLMAKAPDMLLPMSQGADACDAISVGFLGSWVEIAEVAGLEPVSKLPRSCEPLEL